MKLGTRCLGYSLLLLTLVTTPIVSAPEKAPSPSTAHGPVQHPPGQAPVPVAPRAVRTVVVPADLSQPPAHYNVAPRLKALGGPRAAEVPTPKQIKPRARVAVEPSAVGGPAVAPPMQMTPPLATSFDSLDFDSNSANSGFVFIPPDASGVAGPAHAVSVTNVSLAFHDKVTGLVTFEDSLATFFASLAPLTFTFDPKVVYDQFHDRFVIVTLERTAVAAGDAADTSRLLVAVSEDGDPNGTWYLTVIDGSEVFFNGNVPPAGASADHWVDYPGLGVDEEAVYLTGNLFTFSGGEFGGVRLWVIAKELGGGGFYDGGAANVSRFDPYAGCGPGVSCFPVTSQPAHIFGTAPTAPSNVGTWLVSYNGISDGVGAGFDEYVQVLRVDDPVGPGTTTFSHEFVGVGDIEDPFAAPLPDAEQLGLSETIATNDRRALQAVWRDNNRLYFSATIQPVAPDPDAGQATAHWFQLDTTSLGGLTLDDQGNVGGEDIHAAGSVHTFFPSISVNASHEVAVGFSASSASIYAGSYYATRAAGDPAGTIGPSFTLRPGLAPYLRTFCGGDNRWGDYSGMSVDPLDQCFWVYNQHATLTGSPTSAPCQTSGMEDGRWATAFGKFCGASCGDGTIDAGETCDPPGVAAGANGQLCRADCTVCGDGVVDPGEECDDANGVGGDGCENDCTVTPPTCGDGAVNAPGETCDPPGQPGGASGNACRADCTVCGDGSVDPGEACDDGNAVNTDFCLNDCTTPVCGDGLLSSGETCDDGNLIDGDGCEGDCTPTPSCGDGVVNLPGETCDPPAQPAGASGNDCRGDCTVCGDAVQDAGEACDDGNAVDDDACRNDCTVPACGDGLVDAQNNETCDPPGDPAGGNGNTCRADCTVCGDGVTDAGEACDDGNGVDGDACRNDCTLPACGDGLVDAQNNETCDPPGDPAGGNGNTCRADCTVCGDGVTDAGEACDDGNGVGGDACRNDCTLPACGDGIVDTGEECDDGNLVDGDGCEADCSVTPVCGDGALNVAGETCDPPGDPAGGNGNTCRADCTVCGDGVTDAGEACDDGNGVDGDACRNDCTIPACGDGIVDTGEECDDGNLVDGDGCEADCSVTPVCGDGALNVAGETCDPPGDPAGGNGNTCRADCTVCGDGVMDAGEACDDGNGVDGDACRNDCTLPACGDGLVDAQNNETCDPPGDPAGGNGNTCRADCTVCGDGVMDAGEACDDGNGVDGDACRNDCTVPACGDGLVDPGETCDPPGQPAGASGNECRVDCKVCGDGVVDPGEACDDGNTDDLDGCRSNCSIPRCGDGVIDAPGETCDPPGQAGGATGNTCRGDCSVCGDGVVDAGEACDDGNADNLDACRDNCALPACGDGVLDTGEECDDGNTTGGDGCEADCTPTPVCGDGALNAAGETCEPPGQPAGANGNDCRADCTVCGDGVVDPGEDCDDANTDDLDACRNDCSAPICGDGIVDAGETCDPPASPGGVLGNSCRQDCTVCGDGITDAVEECDDGNAFNFDGCRNDCMEPVCGDGIVDPAEDCDDGNAVNGDGCENDCTETPFCGDAVVNSPGETCDPPGQPAGASGNDCRADCTVCGDATVDSGEECDDGNAIDADGCRNACLLPSCGDGIVDAPEETCDPPGQPAGAAGNTCRADCSVCGDGVVDAGEDCDDGNPDNLDSCRNDCSDPACGDGIVDPGEACDDGNAIAGDGCEGDCTETPFCGDGSVNDPGETCDPPGQPGGISGNPCRADCTVCGDGVPDAGEECDDGNADDGDACRSDCTLVVCGDGILDAPGETCDPPGQPSGPVGNLCRGDCSVCGDGQVDAGEECDDGNAFGFDSCRNDCTNPFCGDGIVDATEECDDGNTVSGDGCESDCTETPVCGDGFVSMPTETCDPPGQPSGASGNACRADCTVCGDGVLDSGEACDDGNGDNLDSCRNDCTLPFCGDGFLDAGEDCDDGNAVDGDGCESDCTITLCGDGAINGQGETCDPPGQPGGANGNTCRTDCTVCGDGVLDSGEECDDGNSDDLDGCRNNCRLPDCGDSVINVPGETCDPPARPAGANRNLCRADCTVCGDAVLDAGEQCDDGNSINFDSCRNNCTIPACGDGVLDPGDEECDDGNTTGGDGCEANCAFTPAGSLTSLIFSRIPGDPEITLSWGPSCLASDTDYAIYEGTFPNFATHVPQTCSTGGSQSATFVPAAHSTYYLLVPNNGRAEGSYGYDSQGNQRAASTSACKPRRLGVCL